MTIAMAWMPGTNAMRAAALSRLPIRLSGWRSQVSSRRPSRRRPFCHCRPDVAHPAPIAADARGLAAKNRPQGHQHDERHAGPEDMLPAQALLVAMNGRCALGATFRAG